MNLLRFWGLLWRFYVELQLIIHKCLSVYNGKLNFHHKPFGSYLGRFKLQHRYISFITFLWSASGATILLITSLHFIISKLSKVLWTECILIVQHIWIYFLYNGRSGREQERYFWNVKADNFECKIMVIILFRDSKNKLYVVGL